MAYRHLCSFAFISALFLHLASTQSFNPTILQDSRDLPKVDGTFGFLYRTEDGIAHAAKGDSNGVIHGRFSYTDPTGLKVNYNYHAGSRTGPEQSEAPAPREYQQPQRPYQPPQEEYREAAQYDYDDGAQYADPQPQYVPQTRPPARPQPRRPSPSPSPPARPQYSAQYREPVQSAPQRRTRPQYATHNEVYDYSS